MQISGTKYKPEQSEVLEDSKYVKNLMDTDREGTFTTDGL